MKTVFIVNSVSQQYLYCLRAMINSAQRNTNLDLYCIYSGEHNEIYDLLVEKNVSIIEHTLKFKKKIKDWSFSNLKLNEFYSEIYHNHNWMYNHNFIETDSMRLDIPIIFNEQKIHDDYALYVDIDVIFAQNIGSFNIFDTHIATAKRVGMFKAGVMLLNLPLLYTDYNRFVRYYIDEKYVYSGVPTTQGAYNDWYRSSNTKLDLKYNWHAFWELDKNAKIIHFCGLKPLDYEKIYNGDVNGYSKVFLDIALKNRASVEYYLKEFKKYES